MLLIDTHNLYSCSMALCQSIIDYRELVEHICERYNDPFVGKRFAYVASTPNSRSFCNFLRHQEFIVRSKEIRANKLDNFDVELAMDALIRCGDRRLVICSSSLNLLPLIQELNSNGTSVSVHSIGIPYGIRNACFTEELPRRIIRNEDALAI